MLGQKREYRRKKRQRMRRDAAVVLNATGRPIHCDIWDISDGGARLSIAHPYAELPRSFALLLTTDARVKRSCEVVWRDARFVGVKFISDWIIASGPSAAN